jgi:hypothetical protein
MAEIHFNVNQNLSEDSKGTVYIAVNLDPYCIVALKMNYSNINKINMIIILKYKFSISGFVNIGSFIYLFATFGDVIISEYIACTVEMI